MKFGYFDDRKKEYVITRPDTPKSWSNYLGSTEYGAIITNNAGGYSFYKSAAQGRFTRLRFNSIPMDQPGRYFYIYDIDKKDFWSASWQPVGKPLEKFKSECRHGTAYTVIRSEYDDIVSETLYFVPLNKNYEYWHLKLTNRDTEKRKLRIFTYVEYANNWNIQQDMNNLQYSQFIIKMDVIDNIIDHGTNVFMPPRPDDFQYSDQARHTFLALSGSKITGFDTDREAFLGTYGNYSKPLALERGFCSNSIAVGDNGCGVLQTDIALNPGETKELTVVMGIGKAEEEGRKALQELSHPDKVYAEFRKLVDYWHNRLEGLTAETPDELFNSMFNTWNPYNCMITYSWSRAASLVYSGERDGLGYRDTVQDMLGVLHLIPDEARERLELMITGQTSTGGAMPVVKPFAHKPGCETRPDEREYRSDDCLWLFNTIPAYVKETGDVGFYNKILPYSDEGEDTVFMHLKRAIEFNLKRSGKHGLPCGLAADWNDCLQLGHDGESVFVAFQLRYALHTFIEISDLLGEHSEKQWALSHLNNLDENIKKYGWDGEWFLRAYRADGLKFGSKENDEASIFLNPQSWSIISRHVNQEEGIRIMDTVKNRLLTDYGLLICDPPVENTDPNVNKSRVFNKGMKENASIFNHTQGWAVIAEAILGRGNIAYDYYKRFMPARYNDTAEIREIEPYVYSQFTHSKYSPRYGASRLPWLTGTASWAYFAASQYILGLQPDYYGIKISPCIPSYWNKVSVKRIFRKKLLDITILNNNKKECGVKQIILNGEKIESDFIPITKLKETNQITVYIE
ncbi:glycosyltransferase family 36 [Melioribacter roseus P3M-2]|uniref:Glycosyltransferase family 36 n=1 Tax=Melioribacter roseus (strain DSM 23840 / JCM 17771 / VKM B-2668 / P3M-2) TaxID=1191523 RepID=I7A615_MELRP|nr:N,N'-diacetylchitobiose phosphorylase [Melioribacter roseus]AFN75331.1 glycosyltransferase family 36 [Melioribacter roseus P3M-2]